MAGRIKYNMKTLTTMIACFFLLGCEKERCIGQKEHNWGKWKPKIDSDSNLNWMIKECSECGWQKGKPSEREY